MPHFCVSGIFSEVLMYVVKNPFGAFFHRRWGIFSFRGVGNPAHNPFVHYFRAVAIGRRPSRPFLYIKFGG